MNKKIILLDLDGTVADCTHRLHYIEGYPKDYDGFYDNLDKDIPIQSIIDLVRALEQTQEYLILAVTGRPDSHLRQTQLWLIDNFVPYAKIFMRKAGDFRQDTVIKKEILDQIRNEYGEPTFALDDRATVVKMFRDNGVKVLQVAPGDFDKPKYANHPGKLILLVGPSGAGKSTYITTKIVRREFPNDCLVSSDLIRENICGDFQDQSKNEQVFTAMYRIVRARVESGLLTVVDATNLRNADRKALRDLGPLNTEIEYHVIDRPLKEKLRDGGWRLKVENKGIGLIERHDQIFNSNLKDILAGDGDPRVTVIDTRKLK